MELSTALALIKKGISTSTESQVWADLGAGTGLFTRALSNLLPVGSTIYAIDRDSKAIAGITISSDKIILKKISTDFVNDPLELEPLDGILMANALHFVRDKELFLRKIQRTLKAAARIVIIEYDREASNRWVPYPINYRSLTNLATNVGFRSIQQIGSTPSKYGEANIYSALLAFD